MTVSRFLCYIFKKLRHQYTKNLSLIHWTLLSTCWSSYALHLNWFSHHRCTVLVSSLLSREVVYDAETLQTMHMLEISVQLAGWLSIYSYWVISCLPCSWFAMLFVINSSYNILQVLKFYDTDVQILEISATGDWIICNWPCICNQLVCNVCLIRWDTVIRWCIQQNIPGGITC
jgi:hypothetical protein